MCGFKRDVLADVDDPSYLHDRRLPLSLGKPYCHFLIRVGSSEFLSIVVENCHHEVTMFPPLILSEARPFASHLACLQYSCGEPCYR